MNYRTDSKWQWLAIVALAAALRLVGLGMHSLLFDEAFVAIGARDIAWNHTPMWDAISNAPFVAVLAIVIRLLGDSPFVLRVLPALAGIASVFALYVLQRRFFSRTAALLGALLLAVHPFAVAFSRILFVDALQSLMVIVGWLVIDRYMMEPDARRRRRYIIEIAIVWGIAFILKYNAIVPAGLWILAGWIGGRYRFGRCTAASLAALAGPSLTLLIWPFDAPFWFAAYLRRGGDYDLAHAAQYFVYKLRLIYFGLTPLVTAIAIALRFRRPSAHTRATALFAVFSVLYLLTVILLGRTFERYLLVVVPALSMTIAGLTNWLWLAYRESRKRFERVLIAAALMVIAGVITVGMTIEYIRYGAYLQNDVSVRSVTDRTESLRTDGTRVFWYMPEPVVGYYLGFSRYYSRPLALDTAAAARYNYFEGRPVSHAEDRTSYHVLAIRDFARHEGLARILGHPAAFIDSIRDLSARPLASLPTIDYLTDTAVHSGDIVVVQSGTSDIQGEPLLHSIDTNSLPPMIDRLPRDRFDILAVFRPEGQAPITDTIPTKYRAGVWILRRK